MLSLCKGNYLFVYLYSLLLLSDIKNNVASKPTLRIPHTPFPITSNLKIAPS